MAGPAAAQLYIGATIGQAEFKEGCLGTGECDDKDGAWKILGGYQGNLNGPGADEDTTDLTYGIGVRWGLHEEVGRAR